MADTTLYSPVEVAEGEDENAPPTDPPVSIDLMAIAKQQYKLVFVMSFCTFLVAPLASCQEGYPSWSYVIPAVFIVHSTYVSFHTVRAMLSNKTWNQKFQQLVSTRNPFENIYMLNLVWAPFDKSDNFTDVTNIVQSAYCNAALHDQWVMMWDKSSLFHFFASIAYLVPLWALQLVVYILAIVCQAVIVWHGGTAVHEVRVRSGWWIDRIEFVYSDFTPSAGQGGMGGASMNPFTLQGGEHICEVKGWKMNDDALKSVQFVTTAGRESEEYSGTTIEGQPASPDDFLSKGFTRYSWKVPLGHELTGLDCRTWADRVAISSIHSSPIYNKGSGGASEAGALDLASMLGPAALLSADDTQRWGRALQVSFARVFLESALQTCFAAISFELSFKSMGPLAKVKQTVSLLLSIIASLPKVQDLLILSCSFRIALPILFCLVASMAWAFTKVVMAYKCESHLWSLTTGCVAHT